MLEEMRRQDRLLEEEESQAILMREPHGVLSTIGENGFPYGVPLNYVYFDGKFYFHGAQKAGHKFRNMCHCDKVCFTVVGATKLLPDKITTLYESVIAFGTLSVVNDPAVKQKALEAIIDKFCPGFHQEGMEYIDKMGGKADVFELIPSQITGKAKR